MTDQSTDNLLRKLQEKLERTESMLEINEQAVRTLIEATPVAFLIVSESGKIEAANPACLLLFRCDYTNLVDKQIADMFVSAQVPDLLRNLTQVNPLKKYEVTALRQGDGFPAEITMRPFAKSVSLKFLVVIEDVTARHEIEQMKKEFISMISHDLRTPLTSIQCFLNSISGGMFDSNYAQLKERTAGAEDEVNRLISMINNLLDIDKMEAGRLEIFLDVVPCVDLIKQAMQSVAALAEQRRVNLVAEAPPREVHVSVDTDLLVRVLINLLSNAIKFSPAHESVRISFRVSASHVKLLITDHGPGIPEQFRERMFNKFEQATIADSRIKGGSGLGLAICRQIIDQHHGQIGVDSKQGEGSTFWFTLPRVIL